MSNGITRRGLFSIGAAAAVTAAVPKIIEAAATQEAPIAPDDVCLIRALERIEANSLLVAEGTDSEGITQVRKAHYSDPHVFGVNIAALDEAHYGFAITRAQVSPKWNEEVIAIRRDPTLRQIMGEEMWARMSGK